MPNPIEYSLPATALTRLESIRARATAERAVRLTLIDAQRAAVERKNAAADRLTHVSGFLQNTRIVADRAAAAEVVGTAAAALDAANARLSSCPSAASALAGHVEHFIKHLRTAPVAAKPVKFAPLKNESAQAAVERLRAELRELQADRREVIAAPRHSSEVIASIAEAVESLADAVRPDVLGGLQGGATLGFP